MSESLSFAAGLATGIVFGVWIASKVYRRLIDALTERVQALADSYALLWVVARDKREAAKQAAKQEGK